MVEAQLASGCTAFLAVFQALADENRLRIIDVLQGGERCVCDLQSSLDLPQSLLSHHLRALREAGLVTSRKEGRWVHYALSEEMLKMIGEWIGEIRATTEAAFPHRSRC